jgi:hypothetical protein
VRRLTGEGVHRMAVVRRLTRNAVGVDLANLPLVPWQRTRLLMHLLRMDLRLLRRLLVMDLRLYLRLLAHLRLLVMDLGLYLRLLAHLRLLVRLRLLELWLLVVHLRLLLVHLWLLELRLLLVHRRLLLVHLRLLLVVSRLLRRLLVVSRWGGGAGVMRGVVLLGEGRGGVREQETGGGEAARPGCAMRDSHRCGLQRGESMDGGKAHRPVDDAVPRNRRPGPTARAGVFRGAGNEPARRPARCRGAGGFGPAMSVSRRGILSAPAGLHVGPLRPVVDPNGGTTDPRSVEGPGPGVHSGA